jgi:signal transduction histidine kinase/tetratricopeptide (TPR) repeat protein
MSKGKAEIIFGVLFLSVLATAIYVFWQSTKSDTLAGKNSYTKIENLLHDADSALGYSPDLAEQNANNALNLAVVERNPHYIISADIILGKLQYIKGNYANAHDFYIRALLLAKKNILVKEECEATIHVGEIIYKSGEYDKSLKYFESADSIAEKNNFEELQAYSLYNIGKYNETTGRFNKSIHFYNGAIEICRKNKDDKLLALVLPSLGKYYISIGQLNVALQCYLEAFHISETLNNQLLNAEISNHLGGLYLDMNQYAQSMEYHKKSLSVRSEMNNPEGLAKSYNNIGRAYFGLKQNDSAIVYYNLSLVLCKSINYKKGMVKAQINLGNVYNLLNKPDSAHNILKEAFNLSEKAGYDAGIAEASLALGTLYKGSNQIDTALYYFTLCLSKIKETSYDENLRDTYQGLYDCYVKKGDYKSALHYHESLLETVKRLLNVENNRQLANLSISFDTERKEKDNQVLRKENELKESRIQRNNLFIWLMVVLLGFTIALCFTIYYRFYAKKKANIRLEELNKELEKANQEKDRLLSIIAHELRNPLYWFQNLSDVLSQKYKEMSPEKVQKSLLALDESAKNAFQLMDNLLNWSRSRLNRINPKKAKHSLKAIILDAVRMYETIINYKEIEFQNRASDNVMVFVDADLFSCVIRNLVSNAIKYTPNGGTISIDCSVAEENITVVVSDSGSGIGDADMVNIFADDNTLSVTGLMEEKGSGLGLKLCRDFVKLNGGEIWVESKLGTGTKFFFTVPVQ